MRERIKYDAWRVARWLAKWSRGTDIDRAIFFGPAAATISWVGPIPHGSTIRGAATAIHYTPDAILTEYEAATKSIDTQPGETL